MRDDPTWNKTLKKGDLGTIESVSHVDAFNETQVWVKFDNGSYLALLVGVDEFEIVPKECKMVLYCPACNLDFKYSDVYPLEEGMDIAHCKECNAILEIRGEPNE